jgi:hypothetical protein
MVRLTVVNTSQHLQQLRQSGLIACRKEGLRVFYRLSGDDVIELLGVVVMSFWPRFYRHTSTAFQPYSASSPYYEVCEHKG